MSASLSPSSPMMPKASVRSVISARWNVRPDRNTCGMIPPPEMGRRRLSRSIVWPFTHIGLTAPRVWSVGS